MKHILFFALIFILFACKKEPAKPSLPDGYYGTASAERNGKPWTGHPACWISLADHTSISMELDSFWQDFYGKESLQIWNIPPFVGTYKTHRYIGQNLNQVYSILSMWDSDLPLGGYNILESDSSTNVVALTSYDTLTKEIKGTFNLTFIVSGRPYPSYPDTIRMKNGQFSGKLIKK